MSETSNFFKLKFLCNALKWVFVGSVCICIICVQFFAFNNPKMTGYMKREEKRLGYIKHSWSSIKDIHPIFLRSVVAAEDANFCLHWGLDFDAISQSIQSGANSGASTITQQVVKNLYLWPERSWLRKGLEVAISPLVELLWSKARIIEVYLNIAEFDEGVFGIKSASKHHFGVLPSKLSAAQSSALAAVLPNPRERSAINPKKKLKKRAKAIQDGAETIFLDGRDFCIKIN